MKKPFLNTTLVLVEALSWAAKYALGTADEENSVEKSILKIEDLFRVFPSYFRVPCKFSTQVKHSIKFSS